MKEVKISGVKFEVAGDADIANTLETLTDLNGRGMLRGLLVVYVGNGAHGYAMSGDNLVYPLLATGAIALSEQTLYQFGEAFTPQEKDEDDE